MAPEAFTGKSGCKDDIRLLNVDFRVLLAYLLVKLAAKLNYLKAVHYWHLQIQNCHSDRSQRTLLIEFCLGLDGLLHSLLNEIRNLSSVAEEERFILKPKVFNEVLAGLHVDLLVVGKHDTVKVLTTIQI